MQFEPITLGPALHVCRNMREADRREIFACRWGDDTDTLAEETTRYGPMNWVFGKDGEPIAMMGAVNVHPGLWSVWMWSTPSFYKIRFSLTSFVRRAMIPAIRAQGAWRAECRSMADHVTAHKWLESLGAVREAPAPQYGRNGEDFVVFAWRRSDVPDR